ncbi:U-box domain-containing protein 35-like isoform X1 [Alnus glutinosa]|uniref:U-box domain-containing protein 35-like isoform X1 n=1 Tax=Alnus glutinosa TaxID=3517 RepID=UPI002D77CE02|nr:U-box domain-containing protein 35-like isoform X1 [Alnus glutinosa]
MSALSRESDEESSSDLFEINHEYDYEGSLFSFDFQKWNDSVFVAVGNTESRSSMDALEWTLRYLVTPCTVLHLIHVFPLIRHIPSPLGMLTRGQVKPEMVESYVSQERDKRRKLLQKFLDTCSASKVNVDLLLVESDHTVKAILDLIPVLSIRKLVLGTTKLSLRKSKSKRGSGIADQILHNAPDDCEVNIIYEGREVIDRMIGWSSPRENSSKSKSKSKWIAIRNYFTNKLR